MSQIEKSDLLFSVAESDELLEVARLAIEDALIDMRDRRISEPLRRNGLVCREADGKMSDTIRFGPETAMRIGLRAIAERIRESNPGQPINSSKE